MTVAKVLILRSLLVLFILSKLNFSYSQMTVTYHFNKTVDLDTGFYFNIIKPFYPSLINRDFNFEVDKIHSNNDEYGLKTTCSYIVKDTSVAFIADGFGHPSFVIPNDNISATVKKMEKTNGEYLLNRKYFVPWFYTIQYQGINKFIYSLFDSLSYNTGSPFITAVNLKMADFSLEKYFSILTELYKSREQYISTYCSLHSIPEKIRNLAFVEVRSSYMSNLLQPLNNSVKEFTKSDYPQDYLDTLANFKFDDNYLFTHTILYHNLVFQYLTIYKGSMLGQPDNNVVNKNAYTVINYEVKKSSEKEYLLAIYLRNNIKKNVYFCDSLFTKYKRLFPASLYNRGLDSLLNIQRNITKITYDQALITKIVDSSGNDNNFRYVFKGKPVLIDCWASWCVPCIIQMPFSFKIEKKYKDKIDFIYLSFDKDKNAWLRGQNALNISSGSYILMGDFKSNFALHFNINSIPRYLLFNKNGELVTDNAPRPSKLQLEKLLERITE